MSGGVATLSMVQGLLPRVSPDTHRAMNPAARTKNEDVIHNHHVQVLLETPRGRTAAVTIALDSILEMNDNQEGYDSLLCQLVQAARARDLQDDQAQQQPSQAMKTPSIPAQPFNSSINSNKLLAIMHNGRTLDRCRFPPLALRERLLQCYHNNNHSDHTPIFLQLKCLGRGGMDRQNRVGSKFGGGGVSSAQNSERERKDRLKRLALESIDLAKDPYLMRNHLGTYECKLCLTLHTNEANYLSHTQGKKHQQGLARRAHMEKLKEEKEQQQQQQAGGSLQQQYAQQPKAKKIRIGRPAYQVFKSRDADTNQRCLSFELQYPEIDDELQPRHRFMSAFEQRVETPPDRRFQYLLFAAEPYETVAFKIPNEPIDKGQDKFVTHWDADDKKFTVTLYFLENDQPDGNDNANPMPEAAGVGIAAVS